MKKVAIITLNGYFNYGNRLQNYALQESIGRLGFEVETLINNTQFNTKQTCMLDKIKKIKEKNMKEVYEIFYRKIENHIYKDLKKKRTQIFKDFSLEHINETDYISENHIPEDLIIKYDYFVTGSDQVWNPNYRKGSFIEFLTFAPPEKRIAYAPSFGVSEIPEEYIENYKKWLSEMPHLSVREDAGADIIKKLTGRDVPVLVDPTMLLTKEDWLSISKTPSNKPMKNYLLTYFLGEISKDRKKLILEIAKRNELEIVNLSQVKDKIPFLTGPSEFIDYINSASLFCTDSFHGAVFSILLEKPFIVFKRKGKSPSMNSRIETLLTKFKLESRFAQNIKSNEQIFEIDYSHVPSILQKERDSSINYLKNALNID